MVKHPLTPSMLTVMGDLEPTPLVTGPFDPESDWRREYRVWTCYGYRDKSSNRSQGTLSLTRSGSGGKAFRLKVDQTLHMDPKKEKHDHRFTASIRCRNDDLATPTAWRMDSRFVSGKEGSNPPDMDHAESVEVLGDALAVTIGDRTVTRPASARLASEFSLMAAVGRLPLDSKPLSFDLLEWLTALKPGQRLSYRGRFDQQWGGLAVTLDCFHQLGMGVWPYEYWLDENSRLVMVVTGVRAYILESEEASI
jgi:hypothetical protein